MRTQVDMVVPAQVAEPENQTQRRKSKKPETRNPKPGTRKRKPIDAAEALSRAANGMSLANYPAIFAGFTAKGIHESDIKPRENVFTFNAWRALGRIVRKGEHGVKVATVIVTGEKEQVDPVSGEVQTEARTRPWTSTVFHISQTEPVGGASRPQSVVVVGNPEPEKGNSEPATENIIPVFFTASQNKDRELGIANGAERSTPSPSPQASGWRSRFHRLA